MGHAASLLCNTTRKSRLCVAERSSVMAPPRDPFDPDHPPPHWVDEEGNFGGWMSEAEVTVMARMAENETLPDLELADLLAANDAADDDVLRASENGTLGKPFGRGSAEQLHDQVREGHLRARSERDET
jgi:hypothetical protein